MLDRLSSTPPARAAARNRDSANSPTERLAGDIQREMISAWQAGSPILAEQWLDLHPQISAEPEIAVLVIYEELCLREERGEKVDSAEIYRRFPQFREALSVVLSCHRLMHSDPALFPEAGEEFGEFRLLRELGPRRRRPGVPGHPARRSPTGRWSSSSRRAPGDEHLSLARLQHTHIVPLFLVQEFPERNICALCMPFLGGASWSRILQALHSRPTAGLSGAAIADALAAAQSDLDPAANSNGPAIGFLEQASYEQAVCWIGSCLADALQYAHQRGLLHLDIKPSNVLLAGDGQPMLLDFHLAHEVGQSELNAVDRVGGTPGYMSPEQQRCVQALRSGRPLPIALDPRSDIYSLGVLLYESLTGQDPSPDENASREALRRANPLVSRGLQDLLHKCLSQDRSARYADAGELATDLRRHIANLPLRGVANRSLKERWKKWRRRKPHSLSAWTVGLTALVVIGCGSWFFYQDRLQTARSALDGAEQDLGQGEQGVALERLAAGLQAIRWLPGEQDLKQALQSRLVVARRCAHHPGLAPSGRATEVLGQCRIRPSGQTARVGCRLSGDLASPRRDCPRRVRWLRWPAAQRGNRPVGLGAALDSPHDAQRGRRQHGPGAIEGFGHSGRSQGDVGSLAALAFARASWPASWTRPIATPLCGLPRNREPPGNTTPSAGACCRPATWTMPGGNSNKQSSWTPERSGRTFILPCAIIAASGSQRPWVPPMSASLCLLKPRSAISIALFVYRAWDAMKRRCET